ncbi:hypothetical protein GOV14_01695 [Candidatus Pacearchaeota archaeon]|nr:hypothetical protein [Candidatus Pacearchaeota archaeon]
MDAKTKHLSELWTSDEIQEKRLLLKNYYLEIHEVIQKSYQRQELDKKDKEKYYTALAMVRHYHYALREKISKRDCRKLCSGHLRSIVHEEPIEIRDVCLNRILTTRELRDKYDEAHESFKEKFPELFE